MDEATLNEDWLRTLGWDVRDAWTQAPVDTVDGLRRAVAPLTLERFMELPAALAMPADLRRAVEDELGAAVVTKADLATLARLSNWAEDKGVRRVRTAEGARRFHEPIGAPIVARPRLPGIGDVQAHRPELEAAAREAGYVGAHDPDVGGGGTFATVRGRPVPAEAVRRALAAAAERAAARDPGVRQLPRMADQIVAGTPRRPGEPSFEWQARAVDGLPAALKDEVIWRTRERYAPVAFIAEGASRWRRDRGLPEPRDRIADQRADLAEADRVARAFESAPDESADPRVRAAYEEFKRQSQAMWDFMTAPEPKGLGVRVDFQTAAEGGFTPGTGPYKSAAEQAEDLRRNRHITIESGLGGEHGSTMTVAEYDRFRAVHDVFGHAGVGGGFDRHGEYQAWLAHETMYEGEGARAMSSEYHGVNTALWTGAPGTPGTGRSVLLEGELGASPWDAEGRLRHKAEPAGDEVDRLILLLRLSPAFTARYEAGPLHRAPGARLEAKAVRHVRTPEGSRRFREPIGAPIVDRPEVVEDMPHALGRLAREFRAAHAEPIRASEVAGTDSREVTPAEYRRLAADGAAQLAALEGRASPPEGLDRHLDALSAFAFDEARGPWGGTTIDAHTGEPWPGAGGFAVTVKEPGQRSVTIPEEANPEWFRQAMDEARRRFDAQLHRAQHYLGVFHDDDARRIDFDPVLIVGSRAEVDAIGAYTHAVGGAYDFSTGNGVWPPHVADREMAGVKAERGQQTPAQFFAKDRDPERPVWTPEGVPSDGDEADDEEA
jgi:hypothetical protein